MKTLIQYFAHVVRNNWGAEVTTNENNEIEVYAGPDREWLDDFEIGWRAMNDPSLYRKA